MASNSVTIFHGAHALVSSPSIANMQGCNNSVEKYHFDGEIFSTHERITRAEIFFTRLEKNLATKKGEESSLKALLQHTLQLSPSDANAPTFAEITTAFFKNEGYFKRLFSKESWEEWTENRTPLGKVASQFRDCIESGTRVSKFTKSLNEREIQRANEEAVDLLSKLGKKLDHDSQVFSPAGEKASPLLTTKNLVSKTSPILSSMTRIGEKILGPFKNLRPPPIVPSAIFAYSFSRIHGQPTMMPAMFLSTLLSLIKESNAQPICPLYGSNFDIGSSISSAAVFGNYAYIPSTTSYVVRVFDISDPFNAFEVTPIGGFPNFFIAGVAASENRLVAWSTQGEQSKLRIVRLDCPSTSRSSSSTSISSTSTTTSRSSSSTSISSTSTTTASSSLAASSSSLASESSPQSSDTSRISSTSSLQTISSSSTSSTSVNEKTSFGNIRTHETPPEEKDSRDFKNILLGILIGLGSNLLFTLPLYAKWFSKRRREKNGDSLGVAPPPISRRGFTARSTASSGDESTQELDEEARLAKESPYQRTPDVVTNEGRKPPLDF